MRTGERPCVSAVCGCLIGLLLTLAACGGSSTAQRPAPTNTLAPTPLATVLAGPRPSPVVGPLGAVPGDCPSVPPPRTFSMQSGFGGGFSGTVSFQGSAPAWQLGLASPLHLDQSSDPNNPYPSTKVMWVVGPNYAQPVTLEGHDLHTGAPLWFQIYPSNAAPTNNPDADSVYTTLAVLDPATPNRGDTQNSTGHWNIWGIGIIVLAAGCYELDVTSSEGNWHMDVAAGR